MATYGCTCGRICYCFPSPGVDLVDFSAGSSGAFLGGISQAPACQVGTPNRGRIILTRTNHTTIKTTRNITLYKSMSDSQPFVFLKDTPVHDYRYIGLAGKII